MLTIAVDAMGGDNAPQAEVEGALRAVAELDVKVLLVGQEDVLRKELAKHPNVDASKIEVCHAAEVITMDDSAAKAVRAKKESSIHVAARLVRDGANAERRGVVGHLLRDIVAAKVVDDDIGAGAGKLHRHRFSDAARSAGYQGALSF